MCTVCFSAAQVVPLGALYARAKLVSLRERRAAELPVEEDAVEESAWDDALTGLLDEVESSTDETAVESEVSSSSGELVGSTTSS